MRTRRRTKGAVAVALATLSALGAAAASAAADTNWPGWDLATGNPAGLAIGGNESIRAAGALTLRIASSDDAPWFLLEDAQGVRVGDWPSGGVRIDTDRIFLLAGCSVRRSVDRGASWSTVRLPECRSSGGLAIGTDGDHGLVLAVDGTWGTDDGGATWVRRGDAVPHLTDGTMLLGPTTALQMVTDGTATGLSRTLDGGRTWARVTLPGPPAPVPAGAPAVESDVPQAPDVPALPEPVPTAALPRLTPPALRADGAVVMGTAGAVLVSNDTGASFERIALPRQAGGSDGVVQNVVCDRGAPWCLLQVGVSNSSFTLRFDGGRFAEVTRGSLPQYPVSPLPGVLLGAGGPSQALVRSVDGGATYTTIGGDVSRISVAERGTLALAVRREIRLSADNGDSWATVPLPDGVGPTGVRHLASAAGGGYLALSGSALHRYEGGAWKMVADVASVGPRSMAVVDGEVLVVGSRGIVRVAVDGGRATPVSAPALAGRSYVGIESHARQVVAWSRRQVVRSTDGGRRWHTVRGAPGGGVDDVQLLGAKRFVAVSGYRVYGSAQNGRALRHRGTAPRLRHPTTYGSSPSTLVLNGSSRGMIHTPAGAFRTDDGGRRLVPQPLPESADPWSAVPYRAGAIVRMARSNVVLRSATAGTRRSPTLTARRSGRVMRVDKRYRKVVIVGRIRNAPPDAAVVLVASASKKDEGVIRGWVDVNADGTFRKSLRLLARERFVRGWYEGMVTTKATTPAAAGDYVKIPAARSPKAKRKRG